MKTDERVVDIEHALDLAEEALDRGEAEVALEYCQRVLDVAGEHAGALFVAGEAHRDLRELPEAEELYRRAVRAAPQHSPNWSALGASLFDQVRFEEARSAFSRAIRLDPFNPESYYWRGMLRERHENFAGARRDFRRANRLDPEAYPMPLHLDDATVEAVVEEAVRAMHPSIREYLKQVAILLEEVPEEEVLHQFDPPAAPGEILGYFSGISMRDRSMDNPWSNLPSAIVLFRRNLERIAGDRERLIDELRITVLHEVGHFLGLDEDDLEERGLD
jgi:predicted Zn-dependent protease with MMP-like domain